MTHLRHQGRGGFGMCAFFLLRYSAALSGSLTLPAGLAAATSLALSRQITIGFTSLCFPQKGSRKRKFLPLKSGISSALGNSIGINRSRSSIESSFGGDSESFRHNFVHDFVLGSFATPIG